MKHCYYDDKKKLYTIKKRSNGKTEFFGSYKTIEEATLAVELFEKSGWHKEDNWVIRAEVKEKINGDA